ncbi:MAG TPA: hypothetical protein VFC50_03805 [Candidatus Dormibacteraeota bacterium]|nr:hypothetical protein [Candidatus Dormibacteraeota bacterium]
MAKEPVAKKRQPKKERRDISWADWLGQEANDQQLLNFLQWHVAAIEKHQADPEVQAEVDAQRSAYKSGLAKAIEEGWLHEGAEAAIKKVDGVRVYTGDIFDTILQDMGGYHVRGTDAIVIAAPDDLGSEGHAKTHRIKRAAKHEFNHAVLGMFGARFADEAITEHIAEALDKGEPEILDPANRKDDERIYENERALMAAVLSQGFEAIPVSLATQAYSETDSSRVPVNPFDTNTAGRDVEVSLRVKTDQQQKREMLTSRINASWRTKLGIKDISVSVIDRIDAHVIRLEHHYAIEGMTTMEARSQAAATVLSDLLQQPDVIFGACSKLEPEQTVSLKAISS